MVTAAPASGPPLAPLPAPVPPRPPSCRTLLIVAGQTRLKRCKLRKGPRHEHVPERCAARG
jgi:hypothetical protein